MVNFSSLKEKSPLKASLWHPAVILQTESRPTPLDSPSFSQPVLPLSRYLVCLSWPSVETRQTLWRSTSSSCRYKELILYKHDYSWSQVSSFTEKPDSISQSKTIINPTKTLVLCQHKRQPAVQVLGWPELKNVHSALVTSCRPPSPISYSRGWPRPGARKLAFLQTKSQCCSIL